jgi:hypothetical protein
MAVDCCCGSPAHAGAAISCLDDEQIAATSCVAAALTFDCAQFKHRAEGGTVSSWRGPSPAWCQVNFPGKCLHVSLQGQRRSYPWCYPQTWHRRACIVTLTPMSQNARAVRKTAVVKPHKLAAPGKTPKRRLPAAVTPQIEGDASDAACDHSLPVCSNCGKHNVTLRPHCFDDWCVKCDDSLWATRNDDSATHHGVDAVPRFNAMAACKLPLCVSMLHCN